MDMRDILEDMVKSVNGALGAVVGGFDGVAVEAVVTDEKIKVEEIAASIGMGLTYMQKVAEETKSGDIQNVLIEMDKGTFYFTPINNDYWLGMILEPGANVGRAKLELKKALPKMVKEVS